MNNKNYSAIGVIVIFFIVWVIYKTDTSDNMRSVNPVSTLNKNNNQLPSIDTSVNHIAAPAVSAPEKNKPGKLDYSHLADRLAAMHSRRPEQVFEPAAVDAAVKHNTTWEPAQTIPKHLPLKPEEFTDGRQFIQLDILKLESLMPGDTFKINISEIRRDYAVIIDSVEKNDYNSISWFGHIDGNDGQSYSVSFTRGEQLTVGGVDTPEGHYVLQAHGSDGWIASSKLLFKVNPGDNDQVYPPDMDPHNKEPIKR